MAEPQLHVNYRFGVFFLIGGAVPNPLDLRFQSVSGISADISTSDVREGGQNLFTHRLPDRVNYGNLVLTRGLIVGSPLNIEFNAAMSLLKFSPSNVVVTLLDTHGFPTLGASWLFLKAYPVKWTTSDLSGNNNDVVIDTMELAYTRFQSVRV